MSPADGDQDIERDVTITVTFSEPVTAATAQVPANYRLTGPSGPVPIASATLDGTGTRATLAFAAQSAGGSYRLSVGNVRDLMNADVPMFGICLGHQIMGLAVGGQTYKLKFGHRGANHPVKELQSGKVEITSQNHGFAIDPDSLPADTTVTHLISTGAAVKVLVPTNGTLGTTWTTQSFNDNSWTTGTTGVGRQSGVRSIRRHPT